VPHTPKRVSFSLTPWIFEGDLQPIGAHEITGEPLGGREEQNRPTKGFYEGWFSSYGEELRVSINTP